MTVVRLWRMLATTVPKGCASTDIGIARIAARLGGGARILVGRNRKNRQLEWVDLSDRCSGLVLSAPARHGTSSLLRSILCQGLAKGGRGMVLDITGVSHLWVDGLSNCASHCSQQAITAALDELKAEIQRREVALASGRRPGPRLWVVAERDVAALAGAAGLGWLLRLSPALRVHALVVDEQPPARADGPLVLTGRRGRRAEWQLVTGRRTRTITAAWVASGEAWSLSATRQDDLLRRPPFRADDDSVDR